jgi:hypothetical protein
MSTMTQMNAPETVVWRQFAVVLPLVGFGAPRSLLFWREPCQALVFFPSNHGGFVK